MRFVTVSEQQVALIAPVYTSSPFLLALKLRCAQLVQLVSSNEKELATIDPDLQQFRDRANHPRKSICMADKNRAVDLLAELVSDNDLTGSTISKNKIPKEVRTHLDSWLTDVSIDFEDLDDEVAKGSYFDDEREFYIFSFSVDSAEQYVGKVAIEPGGLIGESSAVSS